ncbi:LOW QUALITY PROTEIN: protein mono-ADP-ribosyltransferase PARP14-like [Xyrauchen texanus]|uniref:LOW QUALITY PROTEIN: protein mono-ADP-ribosyltransferase PARP14-like n=1 Tax=Xyrauchen texanus TaxID=154827 RepID=UPI0022425534|nr:LOW QUALITY PROTEIN: protein mono-ADP-ribosyltransferase PARP14-like [Xyrauchen texanus]
MAEEFPYALFVEGEWDPETPKLKNKLNIYFQSKKSDGGDCEVEHDVSHGQRATVRFKTEEVRHRVLRKPTHELKIGKTNIKMTVSLPLSEVSTAEESTSSVSAITTAQILGSPDTDVTKSKRKAEARSAQLQSVGLLDLKKPRLFGELKSEVEEEEVEPTEEKEDTTCRSAVIENIQNNSQEFLVMLVENVLKGPSESKDFSIEVIPESNCAVVTFSNNMDTENFVMSCSSNAMIKKKNMKVRLLETTSKLKAEGMPLHTSTDYLLLYFERFGEVEDDVIIFEEGQSAIMTFKNPKDVHSVIKQQHHIKKHPFRVLPYYETLQTALYGKDRPLLTLPKAFTENIDETVWHHLKENRNSMDLINQDMSSYFCDLDFQSSAVVIKPLPSLLQQGGQTRKLIQTWREKASTEFSVRVSKFNSTEIHIQKDAWTEIESEIHKAVAAVTVTLVPCVDQGTMAVAGLKEDVNQIESCLRGIVERITERIQREKGSETDGVVMSPSIYQLVLCSGLKQKICDKFPELELTYHAHSQNLTLYGLKTEVLETKNEILQDVVRLIRQPVELHQSVLDFLHKKDLEKMTTDLFFANGIDVALVVEGKRALLVGKTNKALNDGERKLMTELGHLSFAVEDSSVLERSDWQDLVSYIRNSDTEVTVQTTVNEVVVSGFVDTIKDVEKKLRDFVKENSQMEKSLKAHKTVVKFIKEHKTQDWSEEVKGKVGVNFKDDTILISGPYHHVTQYLPMFDTMLKSIQHCTMKIDKPGAKKFFKEKESMCVSLAKTNMGCLIQIIDQYDTPHGLIKSDTKPTYQLKTPDGVEIAVNKADMCSFQVDAVVSASKETLLLDGGLAKALSDAAGPKLKDECNKYVKKRRLMTGDAVLFDAGGQLRCKHVIFAIGPQYNTSKPQEAVALLKKTVKKSLNLADQESCQSVAIPAISSATLGFPLDLCADTIVKAIKEFCDIVGGDSVLTKIHLVDTNDVTVRALEAAVKKMYGVTPVSHSMTIGGGPGLQPHQNQASSSSSQGQSAVHTQGASQSFQTKEGLTISNLKGNIEDTTMDVVVNTLSSNLDLSVGAISNALLKAAGPQLQVLLNQQVTGTANNGAVFVTTGANLKNKLVFHAVVPHWNQGQGSEQKMLEDIIDKCLNEAEQRQQSSIVFSAIGTGNLGFPKALVVCTMLDLVLKFSNKRSSKHLQEVVFALHPKDTATFQVFTDEFNKRFMPQNTSGNNPTLQQSPGPFSKVTMKSGVYETIVGGTTLQVLQGDITAEKTDVIVNSSNKEFTLKSGVSKAILEKAGPNVEAECQQLGAQPNKGLIMTQAGNLQCKKIIHISAQSNGNIIQKQAKKAMQMCAKEKFTSISFPAIGTGQAGLSPGQVADSMMDALVDMVRQTPQSSLKLVRMVVFQAPMLTEFYKSMQDREFTRKQEESAWSKIKTYAASVKSFFTGSWEKEVKQHGGKDFVIEGMKVDPVCFSICGPSQTAVDKTKQFLENMISEQQAFQVFDDTAILSFSDKDQQRIQDLQSTLGVTIRLEYKALKGSEGTAGEAKLTVEGLTRDVLIATQDIQDMLKAAREGEILKRDMEFTSELVDWQYEQGGQYKSFDQRTNFELEQTLSRGAADIKISLQGQSYQIKLPEGPAVSTSGGNQMNIRRIDKLKATESIPQNWDAMAPTDLYKVCNLQPTSSEYNDVLGLFKTSCPTNNVVKIERIQNPGMWKNYHNNKSVMERKNGHQNNEKRLFHGTCEKTIMHINKNGFNRSYAGKNAAAYGNGTYFALNARYSASNTYSVPNAQGQKHMYLCRVLTGDFTKGNAGMIVPPPKQTTSFDLYDTVVDNPAAPTIFVVFRDDNAYPEYLITFT